MENWLTEKMAETSLGGYTLMLAVIGYVLKNLFTGIKSWQDDRKLSLEDRQANREGFTKQIEAMASEVVSLRSENRALRKEYDEHRKICQEETNQLRDNVVNLENRLAGVFRKVADIAIRCARGDVDQHVVASILDLAKEADNMSRGRDGT